MKKEEKNERKSKSIMKKENSSRGGKDTVSCQRTGNTNKQKLVKTGSLREPGPGGPVFRSRKRNPGGKGQAEKREYGSSLRNP